MDISALYNQFPLQSMEKEIAQLFPEWNLKLYDLFQAVLQGNTLDFLKKTAIQILEQFAGELSGIKGVLLTLILLGILSAVFHNLSGIFEHQHLAEYGYYYLYFIMILFLTKIYTVLYDDTKALLENVTLFIRMFLPTYFFTITAAGGSATAVGYYQLFMAVVYVIETILYRIFLPGIAVYMLLNMVNGIWEEEKLTLFIALIKKTIMTGLKVLLALVTGTGMIQSMITPVIDSAKMNVLQKSVSAVPGFGDLAGSASQTLLACAVLIKNATGIILFLLLIILCAVPLGKLFFMMALFKISAAVMGIVADKRMSNTVNHIGDGILMMFQTVLSAATLFVILIAIVAFTANRGI